LTLAGQQIYPFLLNCVPNAVLQNGIFSDPDLPNVPMLGDLVKPKDKPLVMFLDSAGPLGRGLTMQPGVPKNLIPGLRSAYKK